MADREDEFKAAAASRILTELQSWPERWGRGCGDNTSQPDYVLYYVAVL